MITKLLEFSCFLFRSLNAAYNDFTGPLSQDADIIIIAVADSSIDNLFSEGIKHDKIVVYTAGAVSMEVLQPYSKNYGVLYPLQTLRKEMQAAAHDLDFETAALIRDKVRYLQQN